jgi:subtilase family serine protease
MVVFSLAASLVSQMTPRPDRINQELTSGSIVVLHGSVHPLTKRATDIGAVKSDMQLETMALDISLSPEQQNDLDSLMAAQQDPNSPQYHKWLTQAEFGARFGLTDADLNKVTSWLASQGFTVKAVAPSRNSITFSGKVWQAESAFHTQIHQYQFDREVAFANTTEVRLPSGLATVVSNVRGLSSFRVKSASIVGPKPDFTSHSSGSHFLSPGDWATIYNVNAIYTAGYTGTGMHVGIAGQTWIPQSDIDSFRSAAGLSATKLNMVCISSTNCTGTAGESLNDIPEADLDVEWSGGIAKNATVDFIYASGSDASLGVFDAAIYAVTTYQVNGAVIPVLSISYAACETSVGDSYMGAVATYLQQASTQGQTILNSAGDSGAAACDYDATNSTLGAAVNWPASSPNVTAVGGTTFSGDGSDSGADAYWSYSSSADIISSALQYIPETSWNDTSGGSTFASGGGGVSEYYAMPNWQWAPSNFTGANMRFVPDVAFSASADHDGYLVCTSASCASGFRTSDGYLTPYGGTSASSPSFAGMVTLLAQKFGSLGNINPKLYALASNPATYASVFHDITTGTNEQPCTTGTGCVNGFVGYAATTGYDLVTGLGSINGGALYAALVTGEATSTTVSLAPSSVVIGGTSTVTASVTSAAGTPTGTVAFTLGSTSLGSATLSNGEATLNFPATAANGFTVGSDTITASYGGTSTFAPSSGTDALTVSPLPVTTTTATVSPSSVTIGGTTSLTAAVSSTSPGTISGTVTFKMGATTLGSASISNASATLSNVAVTTTNGFGVGSDSITASYGGSTAYAASTGSINLTVTAVPLATTTLSLAVSPTSVMPGSTINLTATVSSTTSGTISGTVTFKVGGTTIATSTVSNGTATASTTVTTANGFSSGASNQITATYSGNVTFAASSGFTNLTVQSLAVTTLQATASPSTVTIGSPTTLTVGVSSGTPGTPSGTVTFKVGTTTLGTVTLSGATASLATTVNAANGFASGWNSISVSYSGDSVFAASTGAVTLVENPPAVTTVATSATPSSLTIGGATTLVASVSSGTAGNITGTVTFKIGTTTLGSPTLNNGTATLSISTAQANGFSVGTDTISATYSGNTSFAASAATVQVTLAAVPTYTLTASPTAVSGSSTVVLSLNSPTTYAGTVSFVTTVTSTNGTPSNVSASAPAITLSAGGNGQSTLTITPNANASNRTPSAPWKSGGVMVFAAVLLGAPFTFRRKRAMTVLIVGLGVTLAGFMVACGGSGNGNGSSKTATSTALVATPSTVMLNGTTTLTSTVSPSSASGSVIFTNGQHTLGTGTISGGAAVLNVVASTANGFASDTTSTLTATYSGDSTHATSGASASMMVSGPRTYTVTVTSTGTGVVTNPSPVSITVTVQ